MTRPSDPAWSHTLPAHLIGKPPIVAGLIQHTQQRRRGPLTRHSVLAELPHHGKHRVHPTRSAASAMLQPEHERRQPACPRPPIQIQLLTPTEIQRQRAGIRLRRTLAAALAQPQIAQIVLGLGNQPQVIIEHRPIPLPRRQRHRKCPHHTTSPRTLRRNRPLQCTTHRQDVSRMSIFATAARQCPTPVGPRRRTPVRRSGYFAVGVGQAKRACWVLCSSAPTSAQATSSTAGASCPGSPIAPAETFDPAIGNQLRDIPFPAATRR